MRYAATADRTNTTRLYTTQFPVPTTNDDSTGVELAHRDTVKLSGGPMSVRAAMDADSFEVYLILSGIIIFIFISINIIH